ncbi:abortive infection protein [Methanosarcina sp. 2.H.T.1A.6]|uniref:CPBP family intramembrane glutamic endopeptidase n=1 Tax=unclassified Methanosarcina TaxID=2644672 RepID=UPI000621896A|nr:MULTISPECIES: type II CAAX endopeptidase family protein [unclassified Methanosarcina]KKG09869.1 abortive infection protein [Methanosarcina sp. 2.H.T.1A.15]KKG17691.1 abortive infection protein [Methanosarcina sp. 2.H.T.1A.3]KKG21931.1 abortive infection protein [Methanosarcina sp. 2.H.T.1A.6]KKG25467.1 abortive infection protein [Methanosarcina sp. 2.H.T.1A.8]
MNTGKSLKRLPVNFFFLVFVLSIPFWLIGALAEQGLPLPINLPMSALSFVCPLIAASILVYRENSLAGVKQLFKKTLDYKKIKPKIWYLPIVLLMPVIMLLSYWAMRLMGRPLPEPQIPFLALPLFFVLFFIPAVCEEAGWMGYAADSMRYRWSALGAGIIMGLVWALWHVVGWYFQAHHTFRWTAGQFLSTVALRIIIFWLYNNTGRSVFAAVLFHDMMNVSEFLFPNYGSHYNPVITGAISTIVVAVVTFLWGPKTLARFRYSHSVA